MKWSIVALLFVAQFAQAQVPDLAVRGELSLPSDITRTVLVEGSGATPALARHDAFRTAIERAAGVVMASETQVVNQRIQRDQSATYSQARISNFAVVTTEQRGKDYWCLVWVTVHSACTVQDTCRN
jgi:hypothetical protein